MLSFLFFYSPSVLLVPLLFPFFSSSLFPSLSFFASLEISYVPPRSKINVQVGDFLPFLDFIYERCSGSSPRAEFRTAGESGDALLMIILGSTGFRDRAVFCIPQNGVSSFFSLLCSLSLSFSFLKRKKEGKERIFYLAEIIRSVVYLRPPARD